MALAARPEQLVTRVGVGARRPSTAHPRLAVLGAWPRGAIRRPVAPTGCASVELHIDRLLVARLSALRPAIVLVDLDGGHFDLPRLCRSVREATDAWIIVTSSSTMSDATIVDALDAGADDVAADSSSAVIDAKVRVGLRVRRTMPVQPAAIGVGDLVIDVRAHELRIDGDQVRCPPVQFELFVALARQLGEVVRNEELVRTIWGAAPSELHLRRVRVAVSAARRILGRAARRPRLETVPRIGYRLVAPAV